MLYLRIIHGYSEVVLSDARPISADLRQPAISWLCWLKNYRRHSIRDIYTVSERDVGHTGQAGNTLNNEL